MIRLIPLDHFALKSGCNLRREKEYKIDILRASKPKYSLQTVSEIRFLCPFRVRNITRFRFSIYGLGMSPQPQLSFHICWSNTILLKYRTTFFIFKQDMFPWIFDHRQATKKLPRFIMRLIIIINNLKELINMVYLQNSIFLSKKSDV